MKFEFVPVLEQLKVIYSIPSSSSRFEQYLSTVVAGATKASELALPPLVKANPMAKSHVLDYVNTLIELKAEEIAQEAVHVANLKFAEVFHAIPISLGLTVLDDAKGGWTNRFINDIERLQVKAELQKTGWLTIPFWISEDLTTDRIYQRVMEWIKRAIIALDKGDPITLAEVMFQEGHALAFAGQIVQLPTDDLEYSYTVIEPYLDQEEHSIIVACMYGDPGALAWGFSPLGLSLDAGFQVALAQYGFNLFDNDQWCGQF